MAVQPIVAIVMGSKSDEPGMKECMEVLDRFGIPYESRIMSAHRTPRMVARFAGEAQSKGFRVIIAAAGLAAALPGVVAAHTILPVIGVPMPGGPLQGKDALYAIVQMPPGIPVATVGIGNGKNAAWLAVSILSLGDPALQQRLTDARKEYGDE